ncbi:MAG: ABC transporter ATP-binding protein [Polyangiaceae bacterium]
MQTILASGLCKVLGQRTALRNVDIAVEPAELVVLLGANGAGKTTLLRVLAGVLRADAGTVSIFGEGSPSSRRARMHLGYAPQSTAIYDELTVEENLAFFARMQRVASCDVPAAIDRGLEFADLVQRRSARASSLSSGMKRRLHVACAVVHQPRALLLDEPTAGVDAESCAHLVSSIDAMRRRGTAIVWSTHDATPLVELGARSMNLANGEVVS